MAIIQVTNTKGVLIFAAIISSVAACLSPLVVFAVYPADLAWYLNRLAPFIAFAVAFPICIVIGVQLRRNHTLSMDLQQMVNRDRLTNLATRDYFFSVMEDAGDSYGISLMVDIDHFKRINDRYGHLAGDRAIQDVARHLQAAVRPGDLVCRFGGEEFVIFLSGADAVDGLRLAERIRSTIHATATEADGVPLSVTVSIGGSLKSLTDTITESIRKADEALYRAKRQGRNCVVMHVPQPLQAIVTAVAVAR